MYCFLILRPRLWYWLMICFFIIICSRSTVPLTSAIFDLWYQYGYRFKVVMLFELQHQCLYPSVDFLNIFAIFSAMFFYLYLVNGQSKLLQQDCLVLIVGSLWLWTLWGVDLFWVPSHHGEIECMYVFVDVLIKQSRLPVHQSEIPVHQSEIPVHQSEIPMYQSGLPVFMPPFSWWLA